jgi:hypothetical protein
MRISEKSWHFRIVNYLDELPSDLCTYFWTLVRNILLGTGVIALIALFLLMVGSLGYNYATDHYIAVEKGYDWSQHRETTSWHVMTAAEQNEMKLQQAKAAVSNSWSEKEKEAAAKWEAQNRKDEFLILAVIVGICIIIAVFIAFGFMMQDYLEDELAGKISAFTIIPAMATIILTMYFSGAYREFSANDPGLCAFIIILHPILITIVWLVIRSLVNIIAAAVTRLTEEKDLSGVDVVVNFVRAKKAKVCPMIDYT